MNCREARRTLYISEYPRLITKELIEAREHLSGCEECRRFMEDERRFKEILRERIYREKAPEELRARIFNAIEKRESRRFFPRMIFIALSILFFILIGYAGSIYLRKPDLIELMVDDYLKLLPSSENIIYTSNSGEVKRWFKGKLGFPVIIPEIKAKLLGGRVCSIKRRRLALLFYEYKGYPFGIFITDRLKGLRTGKEVYINGKRVTVGYLRGCTLVFWKQRGLYYLLICDLKISEIKEIL